LALPTESKHRWALVPDGEGRMHLTDLNPFEVEPEPFFNAAQDVFFVLFTRRNPTAGQRITSTTASIGNSQWRNAATGTRFIIHGFNNNHLSPVNVIITSAYLAAADDNVVRVDWGNFLKLSNKVNFKFLSYYVIRCWCKYNQLFGG
jgi:hypothetical protein